MLSLSKIITFFAISINLLKTFNSQCDIFKKTIILNEDFLKFGKISLILPRNYSKM